MAKSSWLSDGDYRFVHKSDPNDAYNGVCTAAWYERDHVPAGSQPPPDVPLYYMNEVNPNCGGATGYIYWQSSSGGGAACYGCPEGRHECPLPPPSPPPASPPSLPSPPSTPPVCGPTSELTAVVSKMNTHPAFNSAHAAAGDSLTTSPTFNGCAVTCANTCASSNQDIDDDVPIQYCERNDETGVALAYPRCATSCTTAALATSCIGLCATGTYCCASTGGSCIPNGETCPCPDCATPFADGGCTEGDAMYFEVETGSHATKCCAPSPPSPPAAPPMSALCIDGVWPLFAANADAIHASPAGTSQGVYITPLQTMYYMPDGVPESQHGGACPDHAMLLSPPPSASVSYTHLTLPTKA